MLPLVPLSQVADAELPDAVRRIQERLSRETTSEQASVLWTTTYILMGLRYSEEFANQLLRGVIAMKESVTYQAILREGKAEGRAEGRAEGTRQELHKVLLRQGRKRFGPPDSATAAALEAISDLDRLERMSDRMLEAASWDDLLATD
jgi:predicted transposase YdaD